MARVRRWIGRGSPQSDEVDGKTTVGELKNRTASAVHCAVDKLDVMFCGRKLNDDTVLENCAGFTEKSVVYVVEKPQSTTLISPLPPPEEAEGLLSSLQATLVDQHHRALLGRIVSSGETVQNLIDCVPGLRQDTIAQGVLKDPYLLAHWVTDEKVLQHFQKHPSLFEACQHLMNLLHSEVVRHSGQNLEAAVFPAPPPPGVNVGDPFESDDEEEAQNATGAGNQGQQITPQQLAAALAMAGGILPPSQQQPPAARAQQQAPTASSTSTPAAPFITPNMLQMAMQQALAANTRQPREMQEELRQLRDMGFLNAEENARALRVTNGDVMAAVEFIISERERQEQGFGLD